MNTFFKTVATLADGIGRGSALTVAVVFARVGSAGSSGLLQSSIQRELKLAPAVMTKTVQTLSALDLINRSIDNTDSRHRVLRLTEKGQALVQSINNLGSCEVSAHTN